MSNGQFTAGPWHIGKDGDIWSASNCTCVAMIPEDVTDSPANARAIAEAPAMVEALREVLRECVTVRGFPDKGKGRTEAQQIAYDNARAILARIGGAAPNPTRI